MSSFKKAGSPVFWMLAAISVFFTFLYIAMQSAGIYAGDSGDLVAAAWTFGIAHPPGYPLYALLGGILARVVSYNTIAWRVGLLSSLPMALSLGFVWLTIALLTKSRLAATVGSFFYGFLYPVWLYAIVPEAFGLFSLFSILILYIFLRWYQTKNPRYITLLLLFAGLSLTHHHLIILLLLSIGIFFFVHQRSALSYIQHHTLSSIGYFLIGISPYLYAPIASARFPPLDWEHPASLEGFIRLITRASYGTFRATGGAGQNLMDRALNSVSFFHFVLSDFTVLGIVCIVIGFYALHRKDKKLFSFFVWYVALLAFFFFYAGFSDTSSHFILGTLERFFIIPYQVLVIMGSMGLAFLVQGILKHWKRIAHRIPAAVPLCLLMGIVVVVLFRLAATNYHRLEPIATDKTIDRYVNDLFASIPPNAIVDGTSDSFFFPLQYARWVEKKRPDVKIVRFPFLDSVPYREFIKRSYPDIVLPPLSLDPDAQDYIGVFVASNSGTFPIVREKTIDTLPGSWLPHGLVFQYYPDGADIPKPQDVLLNNEYLWSTFSDPLSGALSRYTHLLLSDIPRVYAEKHLVLSRSYLAVNALDKMEHELKQAYRLIPFDSVSYVPLVLFLVHEKRCDEALVIARDRVNQKQDRKYVQTIFHELYTICGIRASDVLGIEQEYQATKESRSPTIQ